MNDEWSNNLEMTFHNEKQIRELFHGLEIISLKEVEEDGTTAKCTPKHWHVFHVIGIKN